MKKILSLVLTAVMLVGTLTIGAGAMKATNEKMVKFDDTTFNEGGGNVGMSNVEAFKDVYSAEGYTIAMDFVFGREGAPCFHPTDTTLKHTSKFAVYLGDSEGSHKYVGYSATEDRFFVAVCANGPFNGEGADGLEFLVDSYDPEHTAYSETGLVKPGVTYRLVFEFIGETGVNIYLDGEQIITFDLYEHLDYPTYFAHYYFLMYHTHITCFIDNVAAYKAGVYNPATGEGVENYTFYNDFEDAIYGSYEDVNEETGETVTVTGLKADGLSFTEAYSLVNPAENIYTQPQYDAEEGDANIQFQSWLDKKANGADEIFSTGQDFKINVTMKNNPGVNSIEMDLLSDENITVKDVEAADGLTANLDGAKLTLTGSNYTGEALATITYTLSDSTTQGYFYRYGAKVATLKVTGASGDVEAVLTNGISKVYNYTPDDMNDDGKFNLADVTLLLKVIAKWELPGVYKAAGDVNDDGRTNSMDAAYYLRWIAGWKGYTIGGITRY